MINFDLDNELINFQQIAKRINPHSGDIPFLPGIDIYGESIFLNGDIGGDHITFIDFNKRFDIETRIQNAIKNGRDHVANKLKETQRKAGILLADAAGHSSTDALLTSMLHQAFLVGAGYELKLYGTITTYLIESINTRFYNSSSIDKYITMIYGEIDQNGEFRFISAAHPLPVVFSNEYNHFVDIHQDRMETYLPIGTLPSEVDLDLKKNKTLYGYKPRYSINQINIMGRGDILVLFTDGLTDDNYGEKNYVTARLEDTLRKVKHGSAKEIFNHIKEDFFSYIEKQSDDVTFIVIKKC
jgi:serine phosphatase RsbU (regulator of sigma subunit)